MDVKALSAADTLYVRITQHSQAADGLCIGGISNLSGIDFENIPKDPILVYGDVEIGEWYQVTVTDVRSAHTVTEVDHPVKGRSGEPLDGSVANSMRVWWVDTGKAECFHATRSCKMLRKREGELLSTEIDSQGKPFPDEISNMRKCHYCY
jgi:hypothetical protein